MCNNHECKCGNVPVVGKVYQSKGEPGFRVSVLYVGMQKVMALVLSRGVIARAVGEEIPLSIKNFGDGHWIEYKEPKVETISAFVLDFHGSKSLHWNKDLGKNLGCIRVTVTDDVLTSVEIVKG